MTRSVISTPRAPRPGGAYSQGMVSGTVLATAGQVGIDPTTGELAVGLEAQTHLALLNVAAVLSAAGLDWSHVIKTTCFLSDVAHFARFDEAYATAVPDPKPPRSTVGVALAGAFLVEIEALAVEPTD